MYNILIAGDHGKQEVRKTVGESLGMYTSHSTSELVTSAPGVGGGRRTQRSSGRVILVAVLGRCCQVTPTREVAVPEARAEILWWYSRRVPEVQNWSRGIHNSSQLRGARLDHEEPTSLRLGRSGREVELHLSIREGTRCPGAENVLIP
jgi:hypothetical protein